MGSWTIHKQGFGESEEADVLQLLPEENRVWFERRFDDAEAEILKDKGWVFCVGLGDVLFERTGRHCGAFYFRRVPQSGSEIQIECLIYCSVGKHSIALSSGPCRSTRAAFEQVAPQTKLLPTNDDLDWSAILIEKVAFPGMSPPTFVNSVAVGLPEIVCSFSWGKKSARFEVHSSSHISRIAAFYDAIAQALAIGPPAAAAGKTGTQKIPPKPSVKKVAAISKHKAIARRAQDAQLVTTAKERWAIERVWLMKLSNPTVAQIQRLHDLNTFQVLFDTLRCYEIDRASRLVAIGRITAEFQRVHSEQCDSAKHARYAACLRALLGKRFAEAGESVAVNAAFNNQVMSRGYEPSKVVRELVRERLLRKSLTGALSISTLGANLLERNIGVHVSAGSLGASLPHGITQMLLELRDARAPGASWFQ